MGAIFCLNLTKISGKKVAAFSEKIWYTFEVEIMHKILMNWIFKNKNLPSETKAFMTFAENKNVLRGKKIKGLLLALFLVGGFLLSSNVFLKPNTALATACTVNADCLNEAVNKTCTNNVCSDYNLLDGLKAAASDVSGNVVTDVIGGVFTKALQYFLSAVLVGLGWVLTVAASLFQWVVTPSNISTDTGLLNQMAVKNVWVMVRDTLNMTFIMILLFAAFCTVFQVDTWNLKKVWLSILINALLVNFSFPIARIFIDISNVAMYYFLNNLFNGTGGGSGSAIMASFSSQSGLAVLLTPTKYSNDSITFLLFSIVFTFILAITLLVLAGLFVIRLIALTMLLMFSPIGFVGYIFPGTKTFASQWWEQLFKYSFFGPIMVFMMMVALAIMKAIPQNFTTAAAGNVVEGVDPHWIGTAALYMIPVIILWTAMGISQEMGIKGSKAIVDIGQKWGKAGLMKMSGAKFAKDTFGAYQTRRKQGDAEKISNRLGKFVGSQQDRLRATLPGRGGKQANQRYQADAAAEAVAAAKLHDTANMDEGQLRELANKGDRYERSAAYLGIAEKGKTKGTEELDQIRKDFGEDSQTFKQLQNKVKTYDPVSAYAHLEKEKQKEKWKDYVTSNQFKAKDLKANSLNDADFMEVGMQEGSITPKDLIELAEKPGVYSNNIKKSLADIAGRTKQDANGDTILAHGDMKNEFDRNIQMAHTAATGKIYKGIQKAQKEEIIKRLDKDSAKMLEATEIEGENGAAFIKHVNTSKFKEIFVNLKKDGSPEALMSSVIEASKSADAKTNLKANQLIEQMRKDPDMRIMFESLGGEFKKKEKKNKK